MAALPPPAALAVARIEALLDEANRLIERTGSVDETAFSLKETQGRYLPDTLNAYWDLPVSGRDAAADALLIEQLQLLERATAQRLAALGDAARSSLAANGAFLAERFAGETLPDVPVPPGSVTAASAAPPRALVARLFDDLSGAVRTDPSQLVQAAGQRFAAVFPGLTTIRRGVFGGAFKSVAVDVPLGADMLRYTLEAQRGGVAASCTKIVRGVALRTERTDLGAWMQGLLEDMTAYVEADRSARETLTRFLAG